MSGRIRTIKPEWLEDELIASAPDHVRILTIGLILLADDHGCGRSAVNFVASEVWKYDRSPEVLTKVTEGLATLSGADGGKLRFIRLYEVDGQSYFEIRSWAKHQRVQHAGARRVPAPPPESTPKNSARKQARKSQETLTNPTEDLGLNPENLAPDLRSLQKDHGEGSQREAPSAPPPAPAPKGPKATRCPSSVDPTAASWCSDRGIPDPASNAEVAKMLDHFTAKPGKDGTKADWLATWRNWEKRSAEYARPTNGRKPWDKPVQPLVERPTKPQPSQDQQPRSADDCPF